MAASACKKATESKKENSRFPPVVPIRFGNPCFMKAYNNSSKEFIEALKQDGCVLTYFGDYIDPMCDKSRSHNIEHMAKQLSSKIAKITKVISDVGISCIPCINSDGDCKWVVSHCTDMTTEVMVHSGSVMTTIYVAGAIHNTSEYKCCKMWFPVVYVLDPCVKTVEAISEV